MGKALLGQDFFEDLQDALIPSDTVCHTGLIVRLSLVG
jgi:hypothetical protein